MTREIKGHEIVSTTAMVKGAGDGLSPALSVDPLNLTHGDRVLLVLDVEVDDIRYPRTKKNRATVDEKYVFQTLDVAIVQDSTNAAALKKLLQEHHAKVQTAVASMKGQGALDLGKGAESLTPAQLRELRRDGKGPKKATGGVRKAAKRARRPAKKS
jgi:hypothetical protein